MSRICKQVHSIAKRADKTRTGRAGCYSTLAIRYRLLPVYANVAIANKPTAAGEAMAYRNVLAPAAPRPPRFAYWGGRPHHYAVDARAYHRVRHVAEKSKTLTITKTMTTTMTTTTTTTTTRTNDTNNKDNNDISNDNNNNNNNTKNNNNNDNSNDNKAEK